ncbi:hypothetical protein KCU81_g15, partial [Aureobasidium melanogenum]
MFRVSTASFYIHHTLLGDNGQIEQCVILMNLRDAAMFILIIYQPYMHLNSIKSGSSYQDSTITPFTLNILVRK